MEQKAHNIHYSGLNFISRAFVLSFFIMTVIASNSYGQAHDPSPQKSDVLIFTNGDKLTGQFERSDGSSVVFKADVAGEITVDWSKIKELLTDREFAVIPQNTRITKRAASKLPQGHIRVEDQKIELSPGENAPSQEIPATTTSHVIDRKTFDDAVEHQPDFFQAWTGALSLGTTLVEATQKNNTISGAVNLLRATPTENWLDPRDRTTLNFNFVYGKLTQPDVPDTKTDLYHLDAEHDWYLSRKMFAFGQAAYDHNFSQGLALQQSYSAGLGWTVIKNAISELDLKASMSYLEQQFQDSTLTPVPVPGTPNQNLIGSVFSENFNHKLAHNIVFMEQGSITPAWNNTNAYSAIGQAGFTIPVYKHFSLALTAIDSFLNNPPPLFKKNSLQFTTGLTYALK